MCKNNYTKMGCGTSSHVMPIGEDVANGHEQLKNGAKLVTNGGQDHDHDRDNNHEELPTMVLPDTPVRPKPPLAFEIPIASLQDGRKTPPQPPPRLQRLLEQPAPEITLPDIEEKLAEAENRRQMILQQRAASASKRVQKAQKIFSEMDKFDRENDLKEGLEKYGSTNTLKIPPEPEAWKDRNI